MKKDNKNFGPVLLEKDTNIVADVYRVRKQEADYLIFSTTFFTMNGIEFIVRKLPTTVTVDTINTVCESNLSTFHLN